MTMKLSFSGVNSLEQFKAILAKTPFLGADLGLMTKYEKRLNELHDKGKFPKEFSIEFVEKKEKNDNYVFIKVMNPMEEKGFNAWKCGICGNINCNHFQRIK